MATFSVQVVLGQSCLTIEKNNIVCERSECEPERTQIFKLGDDRDVSKPLYPSNFSGWVKAGDSIFGQLGENAIARWSLETSDFVWVVPIEQKLAAQVLVKDRSVFAAFKDGKVKKYDLISGKGVWTANLHEYASRPMVSKDDSVFVVTITDKIFKLDISTGKPLWSYDAKKSISSLVVSAGASPLIVGDRVYLGSSNGELLSINLRTGSLLWRLALSTGSYQFKDVVGKLSYNQNKIIATLYDGTIAAVYDKGSKGELLWTKNLSTITSSDLFDKLLVVGFMNGDVSILDPASGDKLSSVNIGQTVTTLYPTRTTVYATGAKGRIAAVEIKSGNLKWVDDVGGSLVFKPINWKDNLFFQSDLSVLYGYKID